MDAIQGGYPYRLEEYFDGDTEIYFAISEAKVPAARLTRGGEDVNRMSASLPAAPSVPRSATTAL